MNTKVLIAIYRYRISVSKGIDPVDALVSAITSVARSQHEYEEIYRAAIAAI